MDICKQYCQRRLWLDNYGKPSAIEREKYCFLMKNICVALNLKNLYNRESSFISFVWNTS